MEAGGLKHSPPLPIVSGLSFERPLGTTNKMADKRNVLANKLVCRDSNLFEIRKGGATTSVEGTSP